MRDDNDSIVLVLLGLGVGWYLYTRLQGLTLGGTYANPMLRPGLTNIQPNANTSAAATNVLASVESSIVGALGAIFTKRPGNAPATTQPSFAGGGVNDPGAPAQGTPAVVMPSSDLNMTDPTVTTIVPYLGWTNPTTLIDAPPPSDPVTGVPLWAWTLNPTDTTVEAPPTI